MASNLVNAIARYEGYGANASNLPTKNNNPGNIVYGKFAASYGAVKDPNSQFAIFPNSDIGFQATSDLLAGPRYSNLSIADAIAKWNGQGSNSASYASTVASWLGLSTNTKVSEALNITNDSTTSVVNTPLASDYYLNNNEEDSSLASSFDTNNLAFIAGVGLIGIIIIKFFR